MNRATIEEVRWDITEMFPSFVKRPTLGSLVLIWIAVGYVFGKRNINPVPPVSRGTCPCVHGLECIWPPGASRCNRAFMKPEFQ